MDNRSFQNKPFAFSMDSGIFIEFKKLCVSQDLSVSQVIRKIIKQYMDEHTEQHTKNANIGGD
jgi:hypothetical protein